jgi:hypothetical protein
MAKEKGAWATWKNLMFLIRSKTCWNNNTLTFPDRLGTENCPSLICYLDLRNFTSVILGSLSNPIFLVEHPAMKLSIFPEWWSVILPYYSCHGGQSYTILKIQKNNNPAYSAWWSIPQYGKIGDSILSQSRFERKFILTKDRAFYDQFLSGRKISTDTKLRPLHTPFRKNSRRIKKHLKSINPCWMKRSIFRQVRLQKEDMSGEGKG